MPMMIISEKNMQFYNYTFYGLFESSHYTSTCEFTEFALAKMMQRFFTAQVQSVFATIDNFRPVLAKKNCPTVSQVGELFYAAKVACLFRPKNLTVALLRLLTLNSFRFHVFISFICLAHTHTHTCPSAFWA